MHQGMAAVTREQLRLAQQQAHRDEQHQRVMREFTQQTQNMTNKLLERTSQTSQEQHQVLRNHIAELTAASKRMQEAAERNATIPPSLYAEHKRTQELVQQLLQQSPAQVPGLESLTGTLTNLVSTVSQGFQTLQ
jgi:septal ring factor EnvC (AmiA/AmiB activator)